MRPLNDDVGSVMVVLEVSLIFKYRISDFSGLFQVAFGICLVDTGYFGTNIVQRAYVQGSVRK